MRPTFAGSCHQRVQCSHTFSLTLEERWILIRLRKWWNVVLSLFDQVQSSIKRNLGQVLSVLSRNRNLPRQGQYGNNGSDPPDILFILYCIFHLQNYRGRRGIYSLGWDRAGVAGRWPPVSLVSVLCVDQWLNYANVSCLRSNLGSKKAPQLGGSSDTMTRVEDRLVSENLTNIWASFASLGWADCQTICHILWTSCCESRSPHPPLQVSAPEHQIRWGPAPGPGSESGPDANTDSGQEQTLKTLQKGKLSKFSNICSRIGQWLSREVPCFITISVSSIQDCSRTSGSRWVLHWPVKTVMC